jgi:hypothetical protein
MGGQDSPSVTQGQFILDPEAMRDGIRNLKIHRRGAAENTEISQSFSPRFLCGTLRLCGELSD